MLLLQANHIGKHFGNQLVLDFDELQIRSGDKIGIIGANGAGKTTLLQILSGELAPDEGMVKRMCRIAYIRQFTEEMAAADTKTLRELNVAGKQERPHVQLSGGERTRLQIACAVSEDAQLLFADEPTANLDLQGVEVLTKRLEQAETLLLISHDRALLDRVCNTIIEISGGKLNTFTGNYTAYSALRKRATEREWAEYETYADEKARLEYALTERQGKARKVKKAPNRMGNSEARLHKREATERAEKINNAANSIQSRIDQLAVKQKPRELPQIKLDFSLTNPPENKILITCERLTFAYDTQVLFRNAAFTLQNRSKTALVGANGTGKTTLLNLVANDSMSNIRKVPKATLGYFHQSFENLDFSRSVLENVLQGSVQTETTARTILARLLLSADDVHKPISVLSGGERVKTAFAKLFVSNANVLLLDEPTNYLDISAMEALQAMLCEYAGTVLFVSHDRSFVDAVADHLLLLQNTTITAFEGNLQAYEQWQSVPRTADKREAGKLVLQMRLTELTMKLSSCKAVEKDAMEAEYQRIAEELSTNI